MTDETKKLFDAPWEVDRPIIGFDYAVKNANGSTIAETSIRDLAFQFARLPELYDALAEAIREACCDCIDQVYDSPRAYDPVLQGCLFQDKKCCEKCRSWIALLNKVREGK